MELNTIYFYTVAILDWVPLLSSDKFKNIVLDSLSDPNDYFYSSCSFYEQQDNHFDWLTHYMDVL